jgi:hypothetical protein
MRADTLKAARRVDLANLSQEFQARRDIMKARHAQEIAGQRRDWRLLAEDRDKIWSDYRKEFGIPDAGQAEDRQQGPGTEQTRRDQFQEASGNGRAYAKPDPRHKPKDGMERQGDRPPPGDQSNRKGWRARRSAAERKADGSYRERDRNKDDDSGGRSRGRDRHEPE